MKYLHKRARKRVTPSRKRKRNSTRQFRKKTYRKRSGRKGPKIQV